MQLDRVEINGRRWYKGPDGKLYPSASSVLDILFPDSKNWIAEDALVRGTLCHEEMAKALLSQVTGRNYPQNDDLQIVHRIRAAMDYLAKFQLETLAIESPAMIYEVGLTIDYLARETGPDGKSIKHLYDWKFAESVTEQYFFQVELYARAEEAHKATILQITRDGQVFPHRVRPEAERWEKIKSAINVRHFIDRGIKRHV